MSTKIEWTDETWNPVTGCTKVSQGCKNCYAERVFKRPYPDREFTDVRCHLDRLDQPLHWKKPRRIFVNSMSDLFHESVPDDFIRDVFRVMEVASGHIYQVLTKRPERMLDFANNRNQRNPHRDPASNIWLGVSCEDQPTADERIPQLLQTPAAVRFVSLEPLLGPIDLHAVTTPDGDGPSSELLWIGTGAGIDWVICGGESGPHARPMQEEWARSLMQQCKTAGVPFFMKQGSKANWPDFKNVEAFPVDLQVREFPNA